MEDVFAFQFCQAIVAITFAVFISDFKRKLGMVPLISEKWTYVLKLLLLVPLFVYVYALITLNGVLPVDLFSFSLTLLGTALVVKAKGTFQGTTLGLGSAWMLQNLFHAEYIHTYGIRFTLGFTFLFSV